MARKKPKPVKDHPEFAAYIAEIERVHREEFLARRGTGKIDGEPTEHARALFFSATDMSRPPK